MQTLYTHRQIHTENNTHTFLHTYTHEQYNYFFVVDMLLQHSTAVERKMHSVSLSGQILYAFDVIIIILIDL